MPDSSLPSAPEKQDDISVICRDCGYLVGGVEAGSRVMWTICGCLYRNAMLPWYRKLWRSFYAR